MTKKEFADRLLELTNKKNKTKRKIEKLMQKDVQLHCQLVELQKQCLHPNVRIKEYGRRANDLCLFECTVCGHQTWDEY